ncbi:MAG TPA: hypothetical protein VE684_21810, partial [Crenalkalicoccus sp.]|nr:hypothetical protein [Crenalkalicoccus sp.]
MPDTILDTHQGAAATGRLLFGDVAAPPLWLWLSLEPEEVRSLEGALLEHLHSALFPARVGERAVRPGDDAGLISFAQGFAPLAPRFVGGAELVIAAYRIVAERGGPLAREAAIACVEALLHRLHAEARSLGDGGTAPVRLRRFVLAARLAADLWLRYVAGPESGRALPTRLAEIL